MALTVLNTIPFLPQSSLSHIEWNIMVQLSSVEIGLITSGSLDSSLIGSVLAFGGADFLREGS
ncbi:hypothetical protein CIPAW_06G018900 [Carya illinoinensis]|uniref:Uncharacterized protein n=1 Tax=Carya illinoinensis TaxID=32201 RepID=A0A8T1Q672_CARIL|nr:hypothetical protein CIPAW_06G018900 [Carya illinoinensis]